MQVYVAGVVNITPGVLIDIGGGEIGSFELLGVATTKEGVQRITRVDADEKMRDLINDAEDYEDLAEAFDYSWRYEIKETTLLDTRRPRKHSGVLSEEEARKNAAPLTSAILSKTKQ